MHATPLTWVTRVLWLILPLTLGDLLAAAMADRSGPVRIATAVLAWAVWGAGLLASLVAQPDALVLLRVLAPVPLVAGVVAALGDAPEALGWLGMAVAAAVAVLAMSSEVGEWFVNGPSYGDERRMPLRPPAVLLVGPLPLVWVLMTVPVVTGVLLLAARSWVAGAVLTGAGAAASAWGFRACSTLARRFAVFVPAGITVVDPLALAEPVLFPRRAVTRLGPAPADTTAVDLTAGAAGLILQIDTDEPIELTPASRRGGVSETTATRSVLVAPSRPGALLGVAEDRRIHVARA